MGCKCQKAGFDYDAYNAARPGTRPAPGTPGGPRGDLRCGNALAGYSRPQRPHIPGFENAPGIRPHRPDLA